MKKQLLILIALFTVVIGYSQTFTDNFITYTVTSTTTVDATDYNTAGGTVVVIPTTVTDNSITYNVTGIGNLAFYQNQLTSVTIPNSVISINLGAFQSNSLTNVTIPDGVTSISNNAFAVNQLTSVIIPSNVTSIGNNAFLNNNSLASVTIPEGVTTIGDSAFLNNQLSYVTLPSTLVSIGIGAFVNNPLTDVTSLATTPPSMSNSNQGTFTNPSTIDLHIPVGTLGLYNSSSWVVFNTITEDALSVSDFELTNDVVVVNTSEELKVISSGASRLENYTIYSISGAKVKEGLENTIVIDVLSNGIYILELNFDTGKLIKKFAK